MDHSSPRSYYDNLGEDELNRLGENEPFYHRLEYERTISQLEEFLPNQGRVLDAGGAAGRYSRWLAENGYEVDLLDVSIEQLSIAQEMVVGEYDSVSISQQSITDIAFEGDTFDAILCTGGPLSHVIDESDRQRAVQEFSRVGKSDSPVFISVMGLLNVLGTLSRGLPEYDESIIMEELARTGEYTEELASKVEDDTVKQFTQCKFYRADELESFLNSNGLNVEKLVGLELFTYGMGELSNSQKENVRGSIDVFDDSDRSLVDLSTHMLAVSYVE